MAKRFTDTEVWDKEWFMSLKPKMKCLVKYVRDKCDAAGIWQPNWSLAKTYIGETVTEKELLNIDNGNQFSKLPGGQIYCHGFINFQYGELSEKCPPHRKIIQLLKKHQITDRVLLGYQYPNERVQEKEEDIDKEKEEEKEEEKEKDKDVQNAELLDYPTFDDFWDLYDKKIARDKCESKWEKLSQEVKSLIMQHAAIYVKSTPDVKYRCGPERYLNEKRWETPLESLSQLNGRHSNNQTNIDAHAYFDRTSRS